MVDKVKPLKIETSIDGTEIDMLPTEADPTEDYLSSKGLAIENQDDILVDADGSGNLQFTDQITGTKILSELLDAEEEDFDPGATDLISTKTGPAIRELADSLTEIPIDALTEFEAFSSDSEETTTSNGWITKSGYPYTTDTKSAGDYVIDHTAQVGQTDKEKTVGHRVQWREGTSGTWIDLIDIRDAVSTDDAFQVRTGFNIVTLSSDTDFQVRIQWGQTDDGGTGKIKFANIKIGKVSD